MKKVCISIYDAAARHAGPKAKVDVETILKNNFDFEIKTLRIIPKSKLNKISRVLCSIIYAIKYRNYDIVIVQTPTSLKKLEKLVFKIIKNKTLFIHDITGLREQNDSILKNEIDYYEECKYIISHNSIMTAFLIEQGIPKEKIVTLELFDYLANGMVNKNKKTYDKKEIIYPGNMKKSPFIFQLTPDKMDFIINAYGNGATEDINDKIKYKGTFAPDEINNLDGNIGLVWDGSFDESDENDTFKNYTRYNNPHKLSCCLAMGIPVIVWRKAATADFIEKNNIGYLISNIYDINSIKMDDYQIKRENAIKFGEKLRDGYYTKKAINELLKRVDEKNE